MKKFLIYMIGTSGSGKTTIATALEKELRKRGHEKLEFIDGDVIRSEFGGIFGYTFEERMRAARATSVVVNYLMKHDVSVILAQVGAFEKNRAIVRDVGKEHYIEVYIKCSYEECARRDVKGYYAKQKRGEMENLNGANDTFEVPVDSHLVIDTEIVSVDEAVKQIITYLENHDIIPKIRS